MVGELTMTYTNSVPGLEQRSQHFGIALRRLAPRLAYLQWTQNSGFDKRVMDYFNGHEADTVTGKRKTSPA